MKNFQEKMKFNFLISTTIVPNKMKKVNIFLQKSTKFLIIILIKSCKKQILWYTININKKGVIK